MRGASLFLTLIASIACRSFGFGVRPFGPVKGRPFSKRDRLSATLVAQELQNELKSACQTKTIDSTYELVCQHTRTALRLAGQERGFESLRTLAKLCQQRRSYSFQESDASDNDRLVSRVPELLPEPVTREVNERLEFMTANGWLSTNADSVDGLPSFHLNLISNGMPVANKFDSAADDDDAESNEFHDTLSRLTDLVRPHVYDNLLPHAQKLLNTPTLEVQDVFLRRYGDEIIDGQSRTGISAHYDVYSHLTAVCALDDTAAHGDNGLYTTATSHHADSPQGLTSNHAALRRFFPLKQGDAVLHTWNVLHGVDVKGGATRTSLVVWFTTRDQNNDSSNTSQNHALNAPWLTNRKDLDTNHVAQFVWASALECLTPEDAVMDNASFSVSTDAARDGRRAPRHQTPNDLYYASARNGNAFALTRLGSLCEEGALTATMVEQVRQLLQQLEFGQEDLHAAVMSSDASDAQNMAKRCWLEGALRGNSLAQSSLADELMLEGTEGGGPSKRLLAATLFGLAAQQGDESAGDALRRVLHYEAAHGDEHTLRRMVESGAAADCL